MVAGHGEERESVALMGKGVENLGYFERKDILGSWWKEKGKKRKRKKEKN